MSETPRRYSAEELRKLADTLSQESSVTTELSPVELEDEVSKALYSASEDAARLEQIGQVMRSLIVSDDPVSYIKRRVLEIIWDARTQGPREVLDLTSSAGRREETEGR